MLKDFRIAPFNGGLTQHVVIFLHGLGDRGDGGLLEIGRLWQKDLPDCEFLCPDAPFPLDHAPPDFYGRQWFTLQNFTPSTMLSGAMTVAPILNEYLDHILATRSLLPDKLALVGFSQGTMMALYLAPRRAKAVGGVIGYSGLLLGKERLQAEKKSSPPVLLMHGLMDDVIPFAALADAESGLLSADIPTTTRSMRAAHTIDDVGAREGLKFLKGIWTPPQP